MTPKELRIGQSAVIAHVGGDGALRARLLEMGLTRGTRITLRKAAPLGDPLELTVRGYTLTLRGEDAQRIELADSAGAEKDAAAVADGTYPADGADKRWEPREADASGRGEAPDGRAHTGRSHNPSPRPGKPGKRGHARAEDPRVQQARQEGAARRMLTLALAGNQNCGKTTLFNALTGSNQHVGNFPGVTVEQKRGMIRNRRDLLVTDLPGIYSLTPYTGEEAVARDYLLSDAPDAIINIVDATNIERNLYLTLQLLELRLPMVVALNMMDEMAKNNGSVDVAMLSATLGVPVVPISAATGAGISELIERAEKTARRRTLPAVQDFCGGAVHRCLHAVAHVIEDHAARAGLSPRYAAGRLIWGDDAFSNELGLSGNEKELVEHSVLEMEGETQTDRREAITDMRYAFIDGAVSLSVTRPKASRAERRSEGIDRILTGKYTAFPVFLLVMSLVFYLTFHVIGSGLSDLMASGIDALTAVVDRGLTAYGINPVVHSLLIDGVFAGVGSVLSFLPIIVTLFFFLSLLEDTGYMARVAFVMDRPLRHLGLSGRSFVPMLIGFGCSVPALMATRTLSSDRDRRMTMLLVPFMSCSAKLPIYAVFAAAFFPAYAALVMTGLYLAGILLAVLAALILKGTAFRGQPIPFVMELPPYRMPRPKNVLLLLWDKAKDFLTRAFTVIFLATVVIWFLQTFDTRLNVVSDSADSLLAMIGRFLAPAFAPAGFADWRAVTALISGFTAKEAVVGTLAVLTGSGVAALSSVLPGMFTTLAAVSYLLFTLLYTPCAAAVAALRREWGGSWATPVVVAGQCLVAWIVATLVYQIGGLLL